MSALFQSYPLGVVLSGRKEFLFHKVSKKKSTQIQLVVSSPYRLGYDVLAEDVAIDEKEARENCSRFQLAKLRNGYYFLTYKTVVDGKTKVKSALSRDLINWSRPRELDFCQGEAGILVSNFKWKDNYLFFFGEEKIKIALSSDLVRWKTAEQEIIAPREGFFDSYPLTVIKPILLKKEIALFYYVKKTNSLGVALLSRKLPNVILSRSNEPLFQAKEDVSPLAVAKYGEKLILYLASEEGEIKEVVLPLRGILLRKQPKSFYVKKWELTLEKYEKNPIIAPIRDHPWESQATFNTAAIYDEEKIHLIYRAIGESGLSVLGYASTRDGMHIDQRLKKPVYTPQETFEYSADIPSKLASSFVSGPGYGGCEDPRITKIEDKFYLTYVAFNGFCHPRVALTSIEEDDFYNHNWNWRRPVLISPPGIVDKNAVIFPEKINDKYVIFHRIYPDILIDFVDSLDFDGRTFLKGEFKISPRQDFWDSRKIGAGAPPIKTEEGWLLIYHAVDEEDPGKYKIGAMLLDLDDPRKVLYRSSQPIIEPTESYENEGHKAGVVYPCGAVVIRGKLHVYYGGADTFVCLATKDFGEFIDRLKHHQVPKLDQVVFRKPLFISHD